MNKYVKFDMLNPAVDHEFTITVPYDSKVGNLAAILAPHMNHCVVSNVSITNDESESAYDECYEIVWNVTDGDPLADLTEVDALGLISKARDMGYTIPLMLTPKLFLELFETMKGDE